MEKFNNRKLIKIQDKIKEVDEAILRYIKALEKLRDESAFIAVKLKNSLEKKSELLRDMETCHTDDVKSA